MSIQQIKSGVIADSAIVAAKIASINAAVISAGTMPKARLPAGSVLQVVRQVVTTQASYTMNGGAIQATALSASITPTSASSHIVVQMMASIQSSGGGQGVYGEIRRGSSTILHAPTGGTQNYPIHWMNIRTLENMGSQLGSQSWLAFDSPNTTSETSYTFYVFGVSGTNNLDLNSQGSARATSIVLLWEIAA